MILYLENPKESTLTHKKLFELINDFNKVAEYMINIQNQFYFYTQKMNSPKIRKQFHLQNHQKDYNA